MAKYLRRKKDRAALYSRVKKMGRSILSRKKAIGGIAGGLALGATAAYAYKRWRDSQKVINKNKQFQKPRRRR